jgi:hypothetical protein
MTTIPSRIEGKLNSPDASDRDIVQFFDFFFPRIPPEKREIPPTSSGCWMIQGHGDDLDIHSRDNLMHAIMANYPTMASDQEVIVNYINRNVKLCIAMGLPGPSAPMGTEEEHGRWAGLTTGEIDIAIIRNIFNLFNNDQTHCNANPSCLDILNFIIRRQLRANFMKIWKTYPTGSWGQFFKKLMGMNEIWVQKTFDAYISTDRSYFLRPNVDEDPDFRAHEGIHLMDMRDAYGDIIPGLVLPSDTDFDINNLEFTECATRFERYFRTLYPGINKRDPHYLAFKTIVAKINNRDDPTVMLSDIILLGYLLKIENLQLYDPTCRPLSDSTREAYTAREAQFTAADVQGALGYQYETLKRQHSFTAGKRKSRRNKINKTRKKRKRRQTKKMR